MITICIVGAGSIGALKPDKYDNPHSKHILTHAHSLYYFKNKKIINDFFIIDNDKEKLLKACKKWKCEGFLSLKELKDNNINIDIFIIAVNTNYHASVMLEILKYYNPKLIIAEKPFCNNYDEALLISNEYKKSKIPIIINYPRRFCPSILEIKSKLEDYGKIRACNLIYVRGFQRDACHAIDLCNYFFGEFKHGKILGGINNTFNDYQDNDLTVPVWMEYEKCKNVYLTPANGNDYSIFEMDILMENTRINIIDHGKKTKVFIKKPEKVYGEFNSIDYEPNEIIDNELESATQFLHAVAIGYLESKNKNKYDLYCTAQNGLAVQEIYKKLYCDLIY